jgi:glucokinase
MSEPHHGTPVALAIDIGATKIALGLVDDSGRIVRRARLVTPASPIADQIWSAIAVPARELLGTLPTVDLVGVGIGTAGPLDPVAGTVSPVLIQAWRDFPIVDRATQLAGGTPVHLTGDGICVAIGEHWAGAGRGVHDMLGVVVSSGIGGGLVLDGRIRVGPTGNAGHVGHLVIDPDGQRCPCGGKGCVELSGSGPSMVSWAVRSGWRPRLGFKPTAVELATAARAGDQIARAAFERGGRAVAAMIASVCAVCDLDLVVVGGGVAEAGALLFDPIRAALAEFAGLGFVQRVHVKPALLGVDAGLIGAAAPLHHPSAYELTLRTVEPTHDSSWIVHSDNVGER